MRSLIVFCLCFWWSYARISETPRKRKLHLKELPTIYLNEQVGASVTLNCPVSPAVARIYRYLSRVRSGKELEYGKRQLSRLIGVKYKWYKDDKAIRHHRSAFSMKLQKVQVEDAGLYTCKVLMSKVGKSRTFVLKVLEPSKRGLPIVESESENITLRAGQTVTLRCISTNTRHRPQIKWLKGNESNELKSQENLEFTQNDIKPQTLSDFGKEYELIDPKHNDLASTSVRARVSHCEKEKSYEFRLKLENVQEKHSGEYVCLVQNKYGRDYKRFFVEVKSMKGAAPYPTHEDLRRSFMVFPAYTTAKLRCYVTGDKPLTHQWYKNGKRFLRRRLDRKVNSTTSFLRIRNLVPSDSGVYTCRVTNPHGVFEHNITVKVLPRIKSAPILLKDYPQNVTSSPGKTVIFQCIELISDPMPDYRWYKWHTVPEGYPKLDVEDTSLYTEIDPIHYTSMKVKMGNSFRYGGRVTLKNITEDDLGLYSCVLRNQLGMDYASAFLQWKSEEGPKFVSSVNRPTLIEMPSTEPLKLDCDATGDPKPNITWFRNGKPLVRKSGMIFSNYTLVLHKLLPKHTGEYSCHVKNSLGSINHTFNIRIKEWLFSRPIILPAAKKVVRSGQRYELKCTIVSNEAPAGSVTKDLGNNKSETLTKKSKPVKLDQNIYQYNYIIRNATIKDSGNYTCVARNAIGVSQRKFQIQVLA